MGASIGISMRWMHSIGTAAITKVPRIGGAAVGAGRNTVKRHQPTGANRVRNHSRV